MTDAEVVTLAVAEAMIGIDKDAEFLAVAAKRLRHLFPKLPKQPGYWKRRARLTETTGWHRDLCRDNPGHHDRVVLLDSTPVESGRSVETVRRSQLADTSGYGYCRGHCARFGGCPCTCWPPRTAGASDDPCPGRPERTRCRSAMLPWGLHGGEVIVVTRATPDAR